MHDPNVPPNAGSAGGRPGAAADRGETALGTPPDASAGPGFGPPVAVGEAGTLGPYRVVKRLGAGGMGAVYLAIDTRIGRKLALKVMLPAFAADADAKARFLREASAAGSIAHDNIVTVFEADERDGVPYIAMPLLQGCSLDEYLKTKGPPALPHVIRIARETALGLAAAHGLGLVHRDIKPANLWLEAPGGRVKVLDFGLAKPLGTDAELTRSGAVIGTPAYMSPEQARGSRVDHRTDLFSLGALLYRLCAGKTPFAGPNVMAVMMALGTEEPTPVRELNPSVPEALAVLVHQLLAKNPDRRPQTAGEVARRLRATLDQVLVTNPPPVVSGAGAVGDASDSLPVVLHGAPDQPPVVVPMQVTAKPEDVFANLGAGDRPGDATEAGPISAAPRPRSRAGGKGVMAAAGLAVLMTAAAGAVVVSQIGRNKEPAANAPDAGGERGNADPNVPAVPLPATFTNSVGMEFVKVPKGVGWLGGGGGQPGEAKVVIESDFYLGKYEVTQGEWEAVTGLTPSTFRRGNEAVKGIGDADLKRFPVETVSWDDCQVFIERLNNREKDSGWAYRLPKEREWEYACRGGPVDRLDSAFDFYFAKPTNTLLPGQANLEWGTGLKRTCRVGSYEPNSLGLHDMSGNVWEWCGDPATEVDGVSLREGRGGGWDVAPRYGRAADRTARPPSFRNHLLGLRLMRVPLGAAIEPPPGPDRTAAEWVIAQGGFVRVNGAGEDIKAADGLPKSPFAVTSVSLHNTQVADEGLEHLKGLRGLKELELTGTQVRGPGLIHLQELNGLTRLMLGSTPVYDAGLEHLNGPQSLTELGLWTTSVSDTGLEHLSKLKRLTTLDVRNTQVKGEGLVQFQHLKELKELKLGGTQVSDAGLARLKELKGLTHLEVSGTQASDAGLIHLKELNALRILEIGDTKVTDAGLPRLKEFKSLTELGLAGTRVSDAGVECLKGFKNLRHLNVPRTKVTAEGVEALHEALPACKIEHDGGVIVPKE